VAPSGGAEKILKKGAQLQIIHYKKPPNIFKITRLNSILVNTNVRDTAVAFGTSCTNLTFFVAPCNEIAIYFLYDCTSTIMAYGRIFLSVRF